MFIEFFAMEYVDPKFEEVLSEDNSNVAVDFSYRGLDKKDHSCHMEGKAKAVIDSMEAMAYEKVLPEVKPTSRMFKVIIHSVQIK